MSQSDATSTATSTVTSSATSTVTSKCLDYLSMTKPRLSAMVLLTSFVGYYLGAQPTLDPLNLLVFLLGTACLAGGSAALNMLIERDRDARMPRTRNRPLPAGRLQTSGVLLFGCTLVAIGVLVLAVKVNLLTSFVGVVVLTSYLFVYTPLKLKTPFNTVVGAVPGALPPVMGWTAATGSLAIEALVLFAILFMWQLPHFLAIAWIYREDYAQGGFAMLPVFDRQGFVTGGQIVNGSLALLVVSLLPTFVGLAGTYYFAGAVILGLGMLGCGIAFTRFRSNLYATRMFLASLVYLPALITLLILDRQV